MKKPITIPFGVTVTFENSLIRNILDKYGPSGWNAWIDSIAKQNLVYPNFDVRLNGPAIQIEFILKDIDLSNRILDGLDLTLVYVSKGNFRDSSLFGSKFLIAPQSDFSGADLRTSFFNSCDVSKANFTEAMIENVIWERAYYYKGNPPIGLPADIMARLQQLEPDVCEMHEPKQIPCQASLTDASHWVIKEQGN